MILSQSEEAGEYKLVRELPHISSVQDAISQNVDAYFDRWVDGLGAQGMATSLSTAFSVTFDKKVIRGRSLRSRLDTALAAYETQAASYRTFFDSEALDEYRGGHEAAFKNDLLREVPIIRGTWNSPSPELNDWKIKFRQKDAKELLTMFENLVDFAGEWRTGRGAAALEVARSPDEVGFDKVDDDPTLYIIGVVGVGIKSAILHHLDPACFPRRDRNAMYALLFLTGKRDLGMPTRTSEFVMTVDKKIGGWEAAERNHRMEHNFWYPYGVFTLHCMHVLRRIGQRSAELGVTIEASHRFVVLAAFLDGVRDLHKLDVRTMLGHDEKLGGAFP